MRSRAKRVGLNVSRQGGKSTISAALALHNALFVPNALVLVAAPSMRQSGELYRKVRAALDLLNPRPTLVEDSATTITLANGSRVVCVPESEATSRGFSNPTLVILDEAARVADESIAAMRPMLANGRGRLFFLSTPAGQRGAFFLAATEHRADWEWHTVPATQIPRISPAFLEQEKRALGPRLYAAEYENAFCETDQALFDLDQINACLSDDVQPLFGPHGSFAARSLDGVLSNVAPLLGVGT